MSATFASFNSALSALRYNQVAHGHGQRQHRQRVDGGLRPPPRRGRGGGCARRAGDVEPLRRLRRRRPRRAASTGWSTRSSTPAPGASTATRPTSTPGRPPSSGSRPGSASPATNGVSAALADFRQGVARPRQQPGLRRRAQPGAVARAARSPTRSAPSRATSRPRRATSGSALLTDVGEVNTLAADLAATNRSIAAAQLSGTDAGTLLDKRDQLALRLSELTGAVASPAPTAAST